MLSQEFIQEIMDNNDIEDVVSYYVQLKHVGGNRAKGLCPFHNEKTPSFCVSLDKQLYYCFGCGSGGTVITFIMKKENLSFIEAIRLLAERSGLKFPEYDDRDNLERNSVYELNKSAAKFFHKQLFSDNGVQAREYLKSRGLNAETVRRLAIGFAPCNYDSDMFEYDSEFLCKAGLFAKNKSGNIYPRFQNRIIFPIVDIYGRVIGFGGRILGDGVPKYLNSPETLVFDKSRNLYGLRHAVKTSEDYFILVEGYMDVASLLQGGIDSAIATLGTAFTRQQAMEIKKRKKSEVVIAYDSDEAGRKAVNRAIDILSSVGIRCRVLSYQGCKDPDEYVKKFGAGAFKALVEKSKNSVEYVLAELKEKFSDNHEGKIAFMKSASDYISKLASPLEREINAKKLSEDEGISFAAIMAEIDQNLKKQGEVPKNGSNNLQLPVEGDVPDSKYKKSQKMLLFIMYNFPETKEKVFSMIDENYFDEGECRELAGMIKSGVTDLEIKNSETLSGFIAELSMTDDFRGDVSLAVTELCKQIIKYNKDKLIKQAMLSDDLEELNRLLLDK